MRWVTVGLGVPAVAAASAALAITSSGAGQNPPGSTTTSTTATTTATAGWNQAVQQMEAGAPQPTLPPAQRQAWIADFDAMAACMHAHGVTDFPEAPATFGDGKTSPPVVGGPLGSAMDSASPTFQAAQTACPFDTSNLTLAAFQAAWDQFFATRASSTATPAPAN